MDPSEELAKSRKHQAALDAYVPSRAPETASTSAMESRAVWLGHGRPPVDTNGAALGTFISVTLPPASSRASHESEPRRDEHVPHSIYQSHGHRINSVPNISDTHRRLSITSQINGLPTLPFSPFSNERGAPFFGSLPKKPAPGELPKFIKPLPSRIGPDEISYLEKKGALTVPRGSLRSEMLRAYVEFVHPYMPLLDLHDFLTMVDQRDGANGKVSLILFQAVMFAGSAFVGMEHLRSAGYATRKDARKDFFQKTRILYDFDYESDRVSLVQALLLLTYYYETPDDQKDTWHWMGVATSVAHTIGLHRNPDNTNLDTKRVKLWKRIWWSTYMRDRLIALGMRRPTRIKTEDFDVPMLTLDDFEIAPLPESIKCLPADCRIARDVDAQRQLAIMCIEKARLCLCISHVLSKQYCVLNNNHGLQNDRTTMMLLPKKLDPATSEVKTCDEELQKWVSELPEEAKYTDKPSGHAAIDLSRCLLHMVFFTTLSALHRPQVLPNAQGASACTPPKAGAESELLDVSRRNVRRAASAITSIAQRLDASGLVQYLPTTGVTVLLPAIIIHLLDIKAPEEETRRTSLRGFCQCMAVMGKLRDLYAAADYSVAFLEAAIRKAGIHVAPVAAAHTSPMAKSAPVTTVEDLVDAGRRLDLVQTATNRITNMRPNLTRPTTLTPPPDSGTTNMSALEKQHNQRNVTDEEVARRLETFLASTPPDSDHEHVSSITISQESPAINVTASASTTESHTTEETMNFTKWSTLDLPQNSFNANINHHQDDEMLFSSLPLNNEFDDFDQLLNLDAVGEAFNMDDAALDYTANFGGNGMNDMDWLNSGNDFTVEA
ncbi:Cutinase transcription factor 1 alpha [Pyrenophora tritici-repentis]|nr:Cutinase transcription factor 1 alpha [Pyrenophora tritici-repentis]